MTPIRLQRTNTAVMVRKRRGQARGEPKDEGALVRFLSMSPWETIGCVSYRFFSILVLLIICRGLIGSPNGTRGCLLDLSPRKVGTARSRVRSEGTGVLECGHDHRIWKNRSEMRHFIFSHLLPQPGTLPG